MAKWYSILDGRDIVQVSPAEEAGYYYFLYVNQKGHWVMMREDVATGKYEFAVGDTALSTAWADRVTLTYKTANEYNVQRP